jgi:ABC-type transporter Mla subunit MlaD
MDVEKTIEFVLQQQAQFSIDLNELGKTVAGLANNVASLTQIVTTVVTVQEQMLRSQRALEERMDRLVQSQMATDERLRSTDERLRSTDERLNVLISVVEKLVSRNGGKA